MNQGQMQAEIGAGIHKPCQGYLQAPLSKIKRSDRYILQTDLSSVQGLTGVPWTYVTKAQVPSSRERCRLS